MGTGTKAWHVCHTLTMPTTVTNATMPAHCLSCLKGNGTVPSVRPMSPVNKQVDHHPSLINALSQVSVRMFVPPSVSNRLTNAWPHSKNVQKAQVGGQRCYAGRMPPWRRQLAELQVQPNVKASRGSNASGVSLGSEERHGSRMRRARARAPWCSGEGKPWKS